MRVIRYREALNQAMIEEMERDERVFLMGEEVGHYQGAYKVSRACSSASASKRVIDTPIAESGFAGIGIGAAMVGPAADHRVHDLELLRWSRSIRSSTTRPRSARCRAGSSTCRSCSAARAARARQVGAQHSQALEHFYAHVPGLKVVAPATPRDAKGLLKTAIRDDNPVLFMEGETLYSAQGRGPRRASTSSRSAWATSSAQGSDVTIVAWCKMVHVALEAADEAGGGGHRGRGRRPAHAAPARRGRSSSSRCARRSRCVVVEEGWPYAGVGGGGDRARQREAFDDLDAPIERVTTDDVPMPYARNLEELVVPSGERVAARAARRLLGRDSPSAGRAARGGSRGPSHRADHGDRPRHAEALRHDGGGQICAGTRGGRPGQAGEISRRGRDRQGDDGVRAFDKGTLFRGQGLRRGSSAPVGQRDRPPVRPGRGGAGQAGEEGGPEERAAEAGGTRRRRGRRRGGGRDGRGRKRSRSAEPKRPEAKAPAAREAAKPAPAADKPAPAEDEEGAEAEDDGRGGSEAVR